MTSNLNVRISDPRELFDSKNRNHYLINKYNPLSKLGFKSLKISDIHMIRPFLKKFSTQHGWESYLKKLRSDPHISNEKERIKVIVKKVQEYKDILNAAMMLPNTAILFGENRGTLIKIKNFLYHTEYADLINVYKHLPEINSILTRLDKVNEDIAKSSFAMENLIRANANRSSSMFIQHDSKLKRLDRESVELHRQLTDKLNYDHVKNNGKIIIDVGYRYNSYRKSAALGHRMVEEAIKYNQEMITRYDEVLTKIRNNYFKVDKKTQKLLDDRIYVLNMQICRYETQLGKLESSNRTLERSLENSLTRFQAKISSNTKGLWENFYHKTGSGNQFDTQGYHNYILSAYRQFFAPNAKVQRFADGTIRLVNWKQNRIIGDRLGNIRIPEKFLKEIHDEYHNLQNYMHMYDGIHDFQDERITSYYGTGKIFNYGSYTTGDRPITTPIDINKGEGYGPSTLFHSESYTRQKGLISAVSDRGHIRDNKKGTDYASTGSYYRQYKNGTIAHIDYEGHLDRTALIDIHRRMIYQRGHDLFGPDTLMKYDPRRKPKGNIWFSFGRLSSDSSRVDLEHNSLIKQLDRWNERDPITPRWVYNDAKKTKTYLDHNTILQRRTEYILSRMYRPDILGNPNNTIINTQGPWKKFLNIESKIANAKSLEALSSAVMETFYHFHLEGMDAHLNPTEHDHSLLSHNKIQQDKMQPEAMHLLVQARKKAFLLNDPSLKHMDAFASDDLLSNPLEARSWAVKVIQERKINGWEEQELAHEEYERLGSPRHKRDQEATGYRFNNDERFVTRRMQGRPVKIYNMGDATPYIDSRGRFKIAKAYEE